MFPSKCKGTSDLLDCNQQGLKSEPTQLILPALLTRPGRGITPSAVKISLICRTVSVTLSCREGGKENSVLGSSSQMMHHTPSQLSVTREVSEVEDVIISGSSCSQAGCMVCSTALFSAMNF